MILEPVLTRRFSNQEAVDIGLYSPVRIAQGDEAEFRSRVDNKVLCETAHVRHGQARPHQELDDEVAVPDAPHAVLRHGLEAELLCEEIAIDAEGVPAERATAESRAWLAMYVLRSYMPHQRQQASSCRKFVYCITRLAWFEAELCRDVCFKTTKGT